MPTPDLPLIHISSQRAEVMWRDGSSLGLHRVHDVALDGSLRPAALFTRALPGGDWWHVFDLRAVAPTLADELPRCPERDVQGLLFYTLRLQHRNATEFRHAVYRARPWTLPLTPSTRYRVPHSHPHKAA